ncbi:MAG: 4Fe-4S binding protein [Armatimonadetes bacterium]|nr:4Fe-4S binding protein [Armatimonadota bacterium]
MAHVIDPTRCRACGLCRGVCPRKAAAEAHKGHVIDAKRCQNCGACARQCPARAIEVME